MEPERRFSYRFAEPTVNTVITWELVPEGTGTRLILVHRILVHRGFDLGSELGRRAYEGMTAGRPGILDRIGAILE